MDNNLTQKLLQDIRNELKIANERHTITPSRSEEIDKALGEFSNGMKPEGDSNLSEADKNLLDGVKGLFG